MAARASYAASGHSGFRHRMMMSNDEIKRSVVTDHVTHDNNTFKDLIAARRFASETLECEQKIRELYNSLQFEIQQLSTQKRGFMHRQPDFRLETINDLKLLLTGTAVQRLSFYKNKRFKFTIFWSVPGKHYVYLEHDAGYRDADNIDIVKQMLRGQVGLRPVDRNNAYLHTFLDSTHQFIKMYQAQKTKLSDFVNKTKGKPVLNFVLSTFKEPFNLIEGFNTRTHNMVYILFTGGQYKYYEIGENMQIRKMLQAATATALIHQMQMPAKLKL